MKAQQTYLPTDISSIVYIITYHQGNISSILAHILEATKIGSWLDFALSLPTRVPSSHPQYASGMLYQSLW